MEKEEIEDKDMKEWEDQVDRGLIHFDFDTWIKLKRKVEKIWDK